MFYEWDEQKRQANLEKHGLDFADSDLVLENPYVLVVDSHAGARRANRRWPMYSMF